MTVALLFNGIKQLQRFWVVSEQTVIVPSLCGQILLSAVRPQRECRGSQGDNLRMTCDFVYPGFELIDNLLARTGFFDDIRETQHSRPPAPLLTTVRCGQWLGYQQHFVLSGGCDAHHADGLSYRAVSGSITP